MPQMSGRSLLVDNYDSYTFNVAQLICNVQGEMPLVVQNDDFESFEELSKVYRFGEHYSNVVISPGPGSPECKDDVKLSREMVLECKKRRIPLLGICLGHQIIAHEFGMKVQLANEPMHGRLSQVIHQGSTDPKSLFYNIPSPFSVVRYHSLITIPQQSNTLETTAHTSSDEVMALKLNNVDFPFFGVQFHPESICTEYGTQIISNFLSLSNPVKQRLLVKEISINSSILNGIYDNLYKNHTKNSGMFYLDSSNPENTRFSYLGDTSGPNSFFLEYILGSDSSFLNLYNHKNESNCLEFTETKQDVDIFAYLEQSTTKLSQDTHVFAVNADIETMNLVSKSIKDAKEYEFDFMCGFVGFFGYKLRHICGVKSTQPGFDIKEAIKKAKSSKPQVLGQEESVPDAGFLFSDRVHVYDHLESKLYLVSFVTNETEERNALEWMKTTIDELQDQNPTTHTSFSQNISFNTEQTNAQYAAQVEICRDKIKQGETYEVCLTQRVSASLPSDFDNSTFYKHLRRNNPAPYSTFISFNFKHTTPNLHFKGTQLCLCCSSPERFLKVTSSGKAISKPIKGTTRRSDNHIQDKKLAQDLQRSEKDRSENLMIVDLVRNDLGRVCHKVVADELFTVESYATVHQLVSTVTGYFDTTTTSCFDVIRACFPGGSMTGAPKKRTMDIIDGLEASERGIYSGSVGFLSLDGSADLNIVIRSVLITEKGLSMGTGGAIVYLSDAQEEVKEAALKIEVLKRTLSGDASV